MIRFLKEAIKGSFLERPARKFRNVVLFVPNKISKASKNISFYLENRKLKDERKIIYALTPPPELNNVGDQAQVVAIFDWLEGYFSDFEVIEFDKNQCYDSIPALKKITNEEDLIILHSGGNLNDRSSWSEGGRRNIVRNFPDNKIVSLPQTVYFSDTERGERELAESQKIYNSHNNLWIFARDPKSNELVKNYFDVKTGTYPDFALRINPFDHFKQGERENVLLCLRRDSESKINEEQKTQIMDYIEEQGHEFDVFDTTLDKPIAKNDRKETVLETLEYISGYNLMITDRFHGVIFAAITETPCIAIDTVDHKISSSIGWFDDVEHVRYAGDYEDIPKLLEVFEESGFEVTSKNWNELYFEKLAEKIESDILND